MQQRLKSRSRAARTQVVAPELFAQLDVAVHDAFAAPDVGFRREGVPPLTRDAESRGGRRNRDACAWQPPAKKADETDLCLAHVLIGEPASTSPGHALGPRFYHAASNSGKRGAATMSSRTAGFSFVKI